eukprot:8613041-Pyramimonas_sp.AAC.1
MQAVARQDSTLAGRSPTGGRYQSSALLLSLEAPRGLDLQTPAQGLEVHASLPASKARAGDDAARQVLVVVLVVALVVVLVVVLVVALVVVLVGALVVVLVVVLVVALVAVLVVVLAVVLVVVLVVAL